MLKIIVNSSNNIEIGESQKQEISTVIEHQLSRFSDRLTRVEAYIEDENGPKVGRTASKPRVGQFSDRLSPTEALAAEQDGPKIGGMDKRCMLEARPEGMQTLNVTVHAATVNEAVKSASHKLEKMIDNAFQRLESIQSRAAHEASRKD